MTGPWTFTSPSVYLAFGTIGAYGKCRPPSKPFTDSVIALDPSELSSVVYTIDFATMICSTCIKGLKYYHEQTKLFDLRDLQGPPPATAYFNAANGANYARDNFYYGPSSEDFFAGSSNLASLQEMRKSVETITEGDYFPVVAIPTRALKDPAFRGCNPLKALDPPVVFSALRTIQAPTLPTFQTASPGSVETVSQPTATGNAVPARGGSEPLGAGSTPGTGKDGLPELPDLIPALGFSAPSKIPAADPPAVVVLPTTVFAIGQATVTASALPDQQTVLVGSRLLSVGGPAAVVAGEIVSLAPNGALQIGSNRVVQIPQVNAGEMVLHIDGKPVTGTLRTDSHGQTELVFGSVTLKPGGPTAIVDGKTLSLDTSGNILEGETAIQTLSRGTLGENQPSRTSDAGYEPSNRSPYTSNPTLPSRKKSGAMRSVRCPWVLVISGLLAYFWT
jgi:hypothetical protein